ncbi:FMN-binding protein [candidate division KSB1 bacterium]|nr:FMN-binding protein [candidate division KSB1 bacterium]NIR70969.1 FMN-binding protein [candidate division KSB1 bacterium]NIS24705.1 FMN-binding protein [candidate division KSB1 bacterium]NIT71614.1 FMN-binding protein [candidate division KSB1 bacterium]NIU25318.1 FMN-binding protein [candidate division KSB1 bacterium]
MNKVCQSVFVVFVNVLFCAALQAQVFKTQQEVLTQAFPEETTITRKVLFLKDEQVEKIQDLAKTKVESKIITYYVGSKADSILGYVFFETQVVRTKPTTFVVIINPDSTVRSVEILAFYEPLDYLPTDNWFELFESNSLNPDLWPRRDIHAITGATLSVRALTFGVRKILSIFQITVVKEETN